jgi:hypothetical protein
MHGLYKNFSFPLRDLTLLRQQSSSHLRIMFDLMISSLLHTPQILIMKEISKLRIDFRLRDKLNGSFYSELVSSYS